MNMVRKLIAILYVLVSVNSYASGIGGTLFQEPELLPANQAFQFELERTADGGANAYFVIADEYYLYKNKFLFELDGKKINAVFPEAKRKDDPLFGAVDVYYNQAVIYLPASHLSAGGMLKVGYQGCAELGVCYPPQKASLELVAVKGAALNTLQQPPSVSTVSPNSSISTIESEQDSILHTLQKQGFWASVALFFVSGLLLAFTPCVFPMVPILSGIIIGQNANTRRSIMISIVYVLAMALTYSIAGVFAGLFGENLQAALQDPWVLSFVALLFVAFALSMFGFYQIQLPASLQARFNAISNQQKSGSLFGVAIMGMISALVVGPCVAPPLAGALLYIGQTGDAYLGGASLFALSMGMGIPLIIFGATAGRLLPKAGAWMDAVKGFFGVLMLALGIWILDRIIPVWLSMVLWSILCIVSAVYMGALDLATTGWRRLWRGLGLVLLIVGTLLLIGASSGGNSLLQPLEHLKGKAGGDQPQPSVFSVVHVGSTLEPALESSRKQGAPVLMYISAKWCISCKELDAITFKNANVQQALRQLNALKVDVTDNTEADKAFLKVHNLVGPPGILFIDAQGNEINNLRVIGMMSPNAFLERLNVLLGR